MRNFRVLTLSGLMACGTSPSKKENPSPDAQQQIDVAPHIEAPSPEPQHEQPNQVESQTQVKPEPQVNAPVTPTTTEEEPELPAKRVQVKHAGVVYDAELRGKVITPIPYSVEYNVAIEEVNWPNGNLLFLSSGENRAESCKIAKTNRSYYLGFNAGVVKIKLNDYPHTPTFGENFLEDAMQQLQIADLEFSPRVAIKTWLRLKPNSVSTVSSQFGAAWTQIKDSVVANVLSSRGDAFVDMNLAMYCDIELGNVSLAFVW